MTRRYPSPGRELATSGHYVTRLTSPGLLSGRSPRQLGWRMLPALVHSANVTSPTSRGRAQCASRARWAGTGVPNGLVPVSNGRSLRIRSASIAW